MPSEQRKKILIVDDEDITRGLLRRNVVLAGYETLLASNGQEAIEMLGKETPDLIIVDLMMPEMNGFETCRRIREMEKTRRTPIVVVSALQGTSDIEDARHAGADDYMMKPVDSEEFKSMLKKYLPSPFKTTP